MKYMTRPYQLKRRAERQDRTRQSIIDAAVSLHQSKGLAATTMSDVAEKAKVGRVTVYRHFADEAALVGACSGQYFERHPLPNPESWRSETNATERLRLGLREAFAYHNETEAMMTRVLAEARDHPVMAPYHAHWQRCAEVLVSAWTAKGRRKKLLYAACVLALSFDTWRILVRVQNLTEAETIDLILRLMDDRVT